MPYTLQDKRTPINPFLDEAAKHITCAGDLNYAFTRLIHLYVKDEINYQRLNDIEGALSNCSKEFNRMVVVPYENMKRKQNGDIGILTYDWL